MNKLFLIMFYFLSYPIYGWPQGKTDTLLMKIIENNDFPILKSVLKDPQSFRCQIIYTQINRDEKNIAHFKNFYFNYDSLTYFNPASTVKLPLACLALEKLNLINKKGINKWTIIQYDSSYREQIPAYRDSTSKNGFPSIENYIKRAFLISENDPYNRLYQFVGQRTINRRLHSLGYPDVRITRQFMGFTPEQNRHTNPIHFINENGKVIYYQKPEYNTDSFDFSHSIFIGKGYKNKIDSLIHEPFDFTRANNISLFDLQQILQSILFPYSVSATQQFKLNNQDRSFLLKYLSQYPSETSCPFYDSSLFYDSYVKFFFQDSTHHIPQYIRIFNKVGWAYGFLTDISYVVDFKHKVEFMLSATIYANSDEILNDDKYDYENVGHPFLLQLGQTIYHYELNRKKKYLPDLSAFRIKYDRRNKNDKRKQIKDVDN